MIILAYSLSAQMLTTAEALPMPWAAPVIKITFPSIRLPVVHAAIFCKHTRANNAPPCYDKEQKWYNVQEYPIYN